MAIAFVLVNTELSYDVEIIGKIKDILTTEDTEYQVHGVYGIYDIVVKISSNNEEKLRKIITEKIRKVGKVQSTLTMMVIEEQG